MLCEHLQADVIRHDDLAAHGRACVVCCAGVQLGQQVAGLQANATSRLRTIAQQKSGTHAAWLCTVRDYKMGNDYVLLHVLFESVAQSRKKTKKAHAAGCSHFTS